MDINLGFVHLYDVGTLASWIGATISALATGTTLWLRRRDRPEADFYLEQAAIVLGDRGRRLVQQSFNSDRDHDECLNLTNIGDGAAFGVVVTSRGCRVRPLAMDADDKRGFRTSLIQARLEPGDSFMILIWNDAGSSPDEIVFKVEWLNAPTRRKRRMSKSMRRSDVVDRYPGEEHYGE
jgi:hypothetical protein